MGSRSHNPMLTSMIQDAILKLCTQNMTFAKSLEIDGIICVSQGEQLPEIVVKMHRTIVKPPVNREQPVVSNSWTYADNTFQGNMYPQVNTLTPQTTQKDFTDQTLASNTSYSSTPHIAENLNMTPSTSRHDTPETQLLTYEHTLPEATQVTPGGNVAKEVTNIKVEASTNKRPSITQYAVEDTPPKKQLKQEIKEEPITLDLDDEDDVGGYDEGGGVDMGDSEPGESTAGNSWMPDDSLDTSAADPDYTLDDSQLEGEKQTDSPTKSKRKNGKIYECRECLFKSTKRWCLVRHQRSQHEGEVFNCTVCKRTFSTKHYLKQHQAVQHFKTQTNDCAICEKTFATKNALIEHEKFKHQGVYKFQCPICSQTFWHKDHYESHVNEHYNARPFVCMKCNKGFNARGTYQAHCKICQNKVAQV